MAVVEQSHPQVLRSSKRKLDKVTGAWSGGNSSVTGPLSSAVFCYSRSTFPSCYSLSLFLLTMCSIPRIMPKLATPIHFMDQAGKFHLQPFVYGQTRKVDFAKRSRTYMEDTTVMYPIRLFAHGDPYNY